MKKFKVGLLQTTLIFNKIVMYIRKIKNLNVLFKDNSGELGNRLNAIAVLIKER